jgi:DNA-binding MarR family transcriptional regulator
MSDDRRNVLDLAMGRMFRLRGLLDPSVAVPGLGMSLSEAFALSELVAGPVSQQELAAGLSLEKSTVSRLVGGMIEKGWVEKDRNPGNRRYHRVALTADGRAAADEVSRAMRERHERVLATLTHRERAAVVVAIDALVRVIDAEIAEQHQDTPS